MGALFGALTALCIGASDLFGRRVVAARGALATAMAMQAVATVASAVMLLAVSSRFDARDFLIGLISGIGLGVGLGCYFGGLARSTATVVSPIVATLSAVIPLAYAILRGADASTWALGGAAVAIIGLVLITVGGGQVAHVAAGVRWSVISGLGYGVGLSIVIEVSEASGAWPAVAQRLAAFVLMLAIAVRSTGGVPTLGGARIVVLVAGTFAALSTVFYLLGVQADPTPAVVTASMFPAVTVAVGRTFYGDPVSRVQLLGLLVVLLGVGGVVTA
jgi:drug/metabolite transporter (DMT)-like permease